MSKLQIFKIRFLFNYRYAFEFFIWFIRLLIGWYLVTTFLWGFFIGAFVKVLFTRWMMAKAALVIILFTMLVTYYEIAFWKRPIIHAFDYYFFYGIYRLIAYLERLEALWVHHR